MTLPGRCVIEGLVAVVIYCIGKGAGYREAKRMLTDLLALTDRIEVQR